MTNPQSTPIVIDTTFGKLYIAVANADPKSYNDSERGDVTDLRGELWIATDAGFDADPNADDHWTIRGRAYAVHYHVVKYRGEWLRSHTPYDGGFRNDRRGQVEFRTKTWEQMWEAVEGALNTFDRQHPGWEDLSRFMLHQSNEDGARGDAITARREAEQHDRTAEGHCARKETAGKLVPASLLALLPKS